ncbi:MAG: NADPH-dependent FMN reductase [Phenylobacterium sp.]|uniref:NADPH-dependent FMN reductase n=1 Tax=Phenylobacterium sp. TaxID=1871053 RepID=UPI00391D3F03
MSLKLNIIVASTRPGRIGPAIGNWLAGFAAEHGRFDTELVDLDDFNLPLLDEAAHPMMQQYTKDHTKAWAQSVASADAYVFVTPEYDGYPPASLVNAVQVVLKEWGRKAAGVVSYGGVSGGLRAAHMLRPLVSTVNVHLVPQAVPLPMVFQHLDGEGGFTPPQPTIDGTKAMLDEVHAWAGALKTLRDGKPAG